MVCMYDGNVFTYSPEDLRILVCEELFQFFNEGHKEDIFVIYDNEHKYFGAITYYSLLSSPDLSNAVIDEKIVLEEGFWNHAYALLAGCIGKVVPVFSKDMELLYLARYECKLEIAWKKLSVLKTLSMEYAGLWESSKYFLKHFHITGCNMVLYEFWKWLALQGISVSVSGEQWEMLGIDTCEEQKEGTVFVDDNCEVIEYLYDEYLYGLREECSQLENAFAEGFLGDMQAENKIMFWMPTIWGVTPMNNIMPLVVMYLKAGKNCMVITPPKEELIQLGSKHMKTTIAFISQVQQLGGNICSCNEIGKICQGRYSVCYTMLIDYIPMFPAEIREKIDTMVVLQSWAFFTHYYMKGPHCTFEKDFSDKVRNAIDFYVVSDFAADWICRQNKLWSNKMLRFGYTKQDALYNYINGKQDIPEEWLEKAKGKKVFLFTILKKEWAETLFQSGKYIVILRPHPLYLNRYGKVIKMYEKISKGKLILDDRDSYNASFCLSDALVTDPFCSLSVNYLSTGKPLLICMHEVNESNIHIDFRQEDWYKAAYKAKTDQDIFDFIDMVSSGEDVKKQELERYRRRMVQDFDGKVCERIYNFFVNYKKEEESI